MNSLRSIVQLYYCTSQHNLIDLQEAIQAEEILSYNAVNNLVEETEVTIEMKMSSSKRKSVSKKPPDADKEPAPTDDELQLLMGAEEDEYGKFGVVVDCLVLSA